MKEAYLRPQPIPNLATFPSSFPNPPLSRSAPPHSVTFPPNGQYLKLADFPTVQNLYLLRCLSHRTHAKLTIIKITSFPAVIELYLLRYLRPCGDSSSQEVQLLRVLPVKTPGKLKVASTNKMQTNSKNIRDFSQNKS